MMAQEMLEFACAVCRKECCENFLECDNAKYGFVPRIESRCKELQQPVDPDYIVTDFEAPVRQAVQQVFGTHVTHRGCFFHLTQSTWRKVQELGLSA